MPTDIEVIEENIYESDLEDFIQQATQQKNYNLAIRLFYLAIIKELSLAKLIKWKRDKTNKDYLNEMRGTELYSSFREQTQIFERIWYGESNLQQTDYANLAGAFQKLLNSAKAKSSLIIN